MAGEQPPPNDTSKRKDAMTIVLLVLLVATFGGGYYHVMGLNRQIHDMEEEIISLQTTNGALESTVDRLEETIATMEANQGKTPTRRGEPLEFEYEPGAISDAWRAFQRIRARVEQPPVTGDALEERIAMEDLNGVRGPELAEIECFEALIGSGGSPYLRTIFESNAEEVVFSKDIGMARTLAPGIENLLAFYVTVGEPESLAFLEELLTGRIAQMAQTQFEGNYFTFATDPIIEDLEECLANRSEEQPAAETDAAPEEAPPEN